PDQPFGPGACDGSQVDTPCTREQLGTLAYIGCCLLGYFCLCLGGSGGEVTIPLPLSGRAGDFAITLSPAGRAGDTTISLPPWGRAGVGGCLYLLALLRAPVRSDLDLGERRTDRDRLSGVGKDLGERAIGGRGWLRVHLVGRDLDQAFTLTDRLAPLFEPFRYLPLCRGLTHPGQGDPHARLRTGPNSTG